MLVGLVGLPNSGKSTFFKALTLADVEIANYPFTTIEANQGVAYVRVPCPCRKVGVKCNPKNSFCIGGNRFVPVKVMDVAGLIEGAHLGKGLGNRFLDDLRQADVLIHVLDVSGTTDEEGKQGEGDPEKKIKILESEIELWLHGIVERNYMKVKKVAETTKRDVLKLLAGELSGLGIREEHVKEAASRHEIGSVEFTRELRKISKPIVIAANKADLPSARENIRKLKSNYDLIPCSAESELALREAERKKMVSYIPGDGEFSLLDPSKLSEKQRKALEYIRRNVLRVYGSTGVQKVLNHAVLDVLGCIVVYPVANINKLTDTKGNVLPDAFILKKGTTLRELAEKIHSDMASKFIGGISYETKQKLGADYVLRDGEIVQVVFGR